MWYVIYNFYYEVCLLGVLVYSIILLGVLALGPLGRRELRGRRRIQSVLRPAPRKPSHRLPPLPTHSPSFMATDNAVRTVQFMATANAVWEIIHAAGT
jgi:hypothetical protein